MQRAIALIKEGRRLSQKTPAVTQHECYVVISRS